MKFTATVAFALAAAAAPQIAASAPTAIHAGGVFDPDSGKVMPDQIIVVDGGKVVAAGPSASVKTPEGARLIDLAGKIVLPGLIDVHTHLTANPEQSGANALTVSTPQEAIFGVVNAKKTLMAGFTTVRNVGAGGFADVALKDAINAGIVPGPRMLVSGPALGATGGHADENLLPWEARHADDGGPSGIADSPWGFRARVRQNAKYGADVIKFMASGGVLSHGDSVGGQQLTQEEMNAIVEEAHMWGRRVAVHAHGTEAIKAAIKAGADSIEHSSLIDDEGIKLAKQHGTYLDFDVYDDDYILAEGAKNGVEEASLAKERSIGKLQRENFRKAWKAGTKMAFATDAGVYPHGWNAKQLKTMVDWGMTPAEAIRSATTSAADLLGMAGKVGCLKVGCYADVIAVDKDPLADITIVQSVTFVMKDGEVVKDAH